MKFLEYILKFSFMFGLSIALVFSVGPAFYKKAMSDVNPSDSSDGLRHFSLDYVFDSEKYVQLKLITNKWDTLSKNYFIPEKEYNNVISFLVNNKLVASENIREIVPLELTPEQLNSLKNIIFKVDGNGIEILAIENHYLVGSNPTSTAKVIYYGLGTIFVILGLFAFLLSSLTLFDTIKTYHRTGKFPNLPNSIDSKINGLKYIFRGFRSKR